MVKPRLLQSGAAHPRGVMMRDCWKNRAGYDRVLITVAATFLTMSATSALAQGDTPRNSAAELAIDAAVPRPEGDPFEELLELAPAAMHVADDDGASHQPNLYLNPFFAPRG